MATKKRNPRATEEQKLNLINYLEANVDFAFDRFEGVDGAHLRDKKWNALARELNALGGANKTGQEWRKYYLDQKNHLKEKRRLLLQQKSGVNGKPLNPLNEYELRLSALISEESIVGDTTQEFGLTQPSQSSAQETENGNDESVNIYNVLEDVDISVTEETSGVNNESFSLHTPRTKSKPNAFVRSYKKKSNGNMKTTEQIICQIENEKKGLLREKLNIHVKRLEIEERRIQIEERRAEAEERRVAVEEQKVVVLQKMADCLAILVPEYLEDKDISLPEDDEQF